jgi:hypothetical protein
VHDRRRQPSPFVGPLQLAFAGDFLAADIFAYFASVELKK